jgi:hypothetical protein
MKKKHGYLLLNLNIPFSPSKSRLVLEPATVWYIPFKTYTPDKDVQSRPRPDMVPIWAGKSNMVLGIHLYSLSVN